MTQGETEFTGRSRERGRELAGREACEKGSKDGAVVWSRPWKAPESKYRGRDAGRREKLVRSDPDARRFRGRLSRLLVLVLRASPVLVLPAEELARRRLGDGLSRAERNVRERGRRQRGGCSSSELETETEKTLAALELGVDGKAQEENESCFHSL